MGLKLLMITVLEKRYQIDKKDSLVLKIELDITNHKNDGCVSRTNLFVKFGTIPQTMVLTANHRLTILVSTYQPIGKLLCGKFQS